MVLYPAPELAGLQLHLLQFHHADELFALIDSNRVHLRPWLPWVDATHTVEDSRSFIRTSLEIFINSRAPTLGILFQDQLAGVISFNMINSHNQVAEIGYWLARDFQGQGIMTQAAACLVNYGFAELKLHRIQIRAATENRPSRAVAERLGFTWEGVLRETEWLYDRFVDHALYAVLSSEWPGCWRR